MHPPTVKNIRRLVQRNYLVSLLLAIAVFAGAVYLSLRFKVRPADDGFEMFSGFVPLNTYHKYPYLDTYEASNREFMTLFKKVFETSSCDTTRIPVDNRRPQQPLIASTASVREKNALFTWFNMQIQQIHANYKTLRTEVYHIHLDPDTNTKVFLWDAVIYRGPPAYHAKHIRMITSVQGAGFTMVSARLLGEVAADQLPAPVASYDPVEMRETAARNPSELTAFTLPSLSEDEARRIVERQSTQQRSR